MAERIPDADLDRWEALCKAATTRPLRINRFDEENGGIVYQIQVDDDCGYILCSFGDEDNPKAKQDAEFEVESRLALPRLIAGYRDLLERNAHLRLIAGVVEEDFRHESH